MHQGQGLQQGLLNIKKTLPASDCLETELLCIDLDPSDIKGAIIKRSLIKKLPGADALKKDQLWVELERMIQNCRPGMAVILPEKDDTCEYVASIDETFKEKYPKLNIYSNDMPCPAKALSVSLADFETGDDMAVWLNSLNHDPMPGGIAFTDNRGLGGGNEGVLSSDRLESLLEFLNPWLDKKESSLLFSLRFYVRASCDFSELANQLQELCQKGLAMIHWQMADDESKLPRSLLWKVSKQGIWNHVSGLNLFDPNRDDGIWVANTPTVVHSFENLCPKESGKTDEPEFLLTNSVRVPESLLDYGRLPAIPGMALWQVVRDPDILLGLLGRIDKKELSRLRVTHGLNQVSVLGKEVTYHFKKPGEISEALMDEIVAMVDAGGSVDITHVRANLEQAYLIGYALENGVVIGNSSLKHPRQVFIDRLKGMTGLDFSHCVERGYTSVRPEYRAMGVGAKLLEGLTSRATDVNVFSIIGEDNLATQKIAIRNNTEKIVVYYSDKLKKEMGVWMPSHMAGSFKKTAVKGSKK